MSSRTTFKGKNEEEGKGEKSKKQLDDVSPDQHQPEQPQIINIGEVVVVIPFTIRPHLHHKCREGGNMPELS